MLFVHSKFLHQIILTFEITTCDCDSCSKLLSSLLALSCFVSCTEQRHNWDDLPFISNVGPVIASTALFFTAAGSLLQICIVHSLLEQSVAAIVVAKFPYCPALVEVVFSSHTLLLSTKTIFGIILFNFWPFGMFPLSSVANRSIAANLLVATATTHPIEWREGFSRFEWKSLISLVARRSTAFFEWDLFH